MKQRKIYSTMILIVVVLSFNSFICFSETAQISASSAIVMDVKTGRVLYKKNINEKKPMASTTKIMTALLALEKMDLNKIVKIPNNAVGIEGSSIYLKKDEKMKMKDLVYGLMLRSGNDSAVAIATTISGSVENFAQLMNKRSKEIGAKNTNFMNPNGLHHKEHYTTAYDLALITREALLNKNFHKIVKTKLWVADRDGYKHFYNKNKILTQYDGGDGVKTGYTKAAGRCLVTSATRNGMQLICVVLNAPNWFNDSYGLLDDAFGKYTAYHAIKKDDVVKRIPIKNGKKIKTCVVSKEDVIVPLTCEEKKQVRTRLNIEESLEAPIKRGQKIGKAKVYLNGNLLYTTDLVTREDIGVKSFKDKVVDFIHRKK
ncbi:D-alanyl-D-alanine carboxypeptidase family protein [Marinisporobacter balticus]|uniref:serine-type D-Ala-D-Ala carboxypeptidase n=1 Tax=Marinisporobacter balticus TaxID=2018667 RepID=A0A4R2L2E7_9FIRM|nr:D-alanyl-D-alanine carboxypeptidase family protein [Marinisporobacter balticus]TCO79822.1 D-alanyl-D-alanine carboxypeptidase (penicillin-binding protein 5/6) [Marinisporobacter balticus]